MSSLAEASILVYEGPVRVFEGEGQEEYQAGRPQPFLPSQVVRSKKMLSMKTSSSVNEIEYMSASTIVGVMNRFCHQKPGGQFLPPGFAYSSSCIYCKLGTCLGPNCMGLLKKEPKKSFTRISHLHPPSIPGLNKSSQLTTTLTSIKQTPLSRNSGNAFHRTGAFSFINKSLLAIATSKPGKHKRRRSSKPKERYFLFVLLLFMI